MKRKLYITRTVKLVCFLLVIVLCASFLQTFILRRIDNNSLRMDGYFLEDKNSLDVVLIGASDVYAGYSAPYAYEKYGYTSYPFATQSSPASIVLPQIKEVLKYQSPKMIVVEINAFLYKDNELPTSASQRMFADNVPHDKIWYDYVNENIPEDEQLEYYLPIVKYHGSWSDYPWKLKYLRESINQMSRGYSLFRGYKTVANEFHPTVKTYNDKLANDDKALPLGANANRFLTETLEYLKENNITNVVFMRFPHIVNDKALTRSYRCNEAGKIIESYGYDFYNLERYAAEEGFEIEKDFYNWDHLNVYGTEKLTDYVATLMTEKYGVTGTALTDAQKAEWENSVDYYHKIFNYSEAMIAKRKKLGKTGNGGTTVSEDSKSIATIDKYAENHPEAGKYGDKSAAEE